MIFTMCLMPPLPPFNPIVGGAPCAAAAATRPAFNTNQFSPAPSSPRTKEMHRQDLSSLSPHKLFTRQNFTRGDEGDALTEKYAANPHPSSSYILSTHHKYRCSSSTFLNEVLKEVSMQFRGTIAEGFMHITTDTDNIHTAD